MTNEEAFEYYCETVPMPKAKEPPMTDSTEMDVVEIVRAWAKAYRDTPEHRFPSDPHAEFFPVDLDSICDEMLRLRAERDAAARDMRERAAKAVRDTICTADWPPEDGDELIDDLQAAIRALPIAVVATESGGAT